MFYLASPEINRKKKVINNPKKPLQSVALLGLSGRELRVKSLPIKSCQLQGERRKLKAKKIKSLELSREKEKGES